MKYGSCMGGSGSCFTHFLKLHLEFFHDSEVGYNRLSFKHVVIVIFCSDDTDFARIHGLELLLNFFVSRVQAMLAMSVASIAV